MSGRDPDEDEAIYYSTPPRNEVPPEEVVPVTEPESDDDEGEAEPGDDDYVDPDSTGENLAAAINQSLPAVAHRINVWPHAKPVPGEVYGFHDPTYGVNMIALQMDTWQSIMDDMRTLRDRMNQLSAENIEFRQGRKPEDMPRIVMPTPTFRRLVS